MNKLCLLTYDMTQEKPQNVVANIRTENPDVLCLTSVTESMYHSLSKHLNDTFMAFQVFIEEHEPQGTVILCNQQTMCISSEEEPYYFDYPQVSGKIIGTGVTHLNSKTSFSIVTAEIDHYDENTRQIQFQTLTKVLEGLKDCLIMGHVGFLELEGFRDTWQRIGCPQRLKTDEQRLNRTYFNSGILIPKSMSVIGNGMETVFYINRRTRAH